MEKHIEVVANFDTGVVTVWERWFPSDTHPGWDRLLGEIEKEPEPEEQDPERWDGLS